MNEKNPVSNHSSADIWSSDENVPEYYPGGQGVSGEAPGPYGYSESMPKLDDERVAPASFSGVGEEYVNHSRNYVPLPDFIDGSATEVGKMLGSLNEEFRYWREARSYGEADPEEFSQRFLEGAYAVVRNIGDGVLSRSSAESSTLLAAVGNVPNLKISSRSESDRGALGAIRTRRPHDGVSRGDSMAIDLDAIYDLQVPMVQESLRKHDIHMPHSTLAFLFSARTVAHESAHVIQGQIGKMVGLGGGEAVDYMSSFFTEASGASAEAINEGFAEGYAELVLGAMLSELGYGVTEAAGIVHAMSHRDSPKNVERGYLAIPQSGMEMMLEHVSGEIRKRNDF